MAVGAVSGNTSPVPSQPPLPPSSAAVGGKNDGDEATESTATKAKEASASGGSSLPVDTNRGRNLNISV